MTISKLVDGKEFRLIFTPYIRKNGQIIYPKHSKVFSFWVAV